MDLYTVVCTASELYSVYTHIILEMDTLDLINTTHSHLKLTCGVAGLMLSDLSCLRPLGLSWAFVPVIPLSWCGVKVSGKGTVNHMRLNITAILRLRRAPTYIHSLACLGTLFLQDW